MKFNSAEEAIEYLHAESERRVMLRFICSSLERMCCLVHPFWRIEIWITGRHCNLSLLSLWLNDKYDLGVWSD